MRRIKTYKLFIESIQLDSSIEQIIDITESLSVDHNDLLSSIMAEEKNILDEFKFQADDGWTLESLCGNADFIKCLSKLGYTLGEIENSDDYQTFYF